MMKLTFLLVNFLYFAVAQESELVLVQVFHRHGSKIPDAIDPTNAEIWEQFNLNNGDLSPLGVTEMRSLGSLLRQRYIVNEPLLPDRFDLTLLHVRASSFNQRPLPSSAALLQTLYPGSPVPIFTDDPTRDTLLLSMWACPSYTLEVERQLRRVGEIALTEYADLMSNISERTGFMAADLQYPRIFDLSGCTTCTPDECPEMVAWIANDGMEMTIRHGFGDTVDPYFLQDETRQTMEDLMILFEEAPWDMRDDNDPRGPSLGELTREVIANIENALDGSSPLKMVQYSMHSIPMTQLRDSFGLPSVWPHTGDAIALELRRRPDGEYFVRADYLEPEFGGDAYSSRPDPLRCPDLAEECSLDPFLLFVGARNALPPTDGGCCFVREAFAEVGCTDFLNPDTLDIWECRDWRDRCPQTACGPNQIVDSATLRCFEIKDQK